MATMRTMRARLVWAALIGGILVGLPAGPGLGVAEGAGSGSGRAPARAPSPTSAQGIRAFVSVPVWYLDYEVTIEAHSPNHDTELHSVVTGRLALDARTVGPNLSSGVDMTHVPTIPHGSMPTAAQMQSLMGTAAARINEINDGATWIMQPPEEAGSDVVSEARFKAYVDSIAPTQTITYKVNQSQVQIDARGSGRPMAGATYMFDVNVGTKKWALNLPVMYFDTERTQNAVRGTERRDVGDHWETKPFARDLSSFFSSYEYTPEPENTGNAIVIRGVLPEQLGALSQQQSFEIRNSSYEGTLTQKVTISPFPVQPIELVIHPPDDYKDWRPMGVMTEAEIGNTMTIRSTLQKVGGGAPPFKAVRFAYKLLNTSRVPGVCLNWPPTPATPPTPDIVIPGELNKDLMIDDDDFQSASVTGTDMVESSVVLASRDYGGYTALQVTAELSNGDVVIGVVEGGNGEQSLRVPNRPVDSHVAYSYLDRYRVTGDDDKDDVDDEPEGDRFKGDGLTMYEEYRGFMEKGFWIETDPTVKDLFVLNAMRTHASVKKGIALFQRLSGLDVHSDFDPQEFGVASVLNLHHGGEPHLVDQHGIVIAVRLDADDAAHVLNVGTPKDSKRVEVPPGWPVTCSSCVNPAGTPVDYFAVTTAHEMLHAVNVYHHGESDETATWKRRSLLGHTFYIEEYRDGQDMGSVHIKTEAGVEVTPETLFGPNGDEVKQTIGMPHCQHSGAEECVMRYDNATAYISAADPQVRYLVTERVGDSICHSIVGTGVNAAGRTPQPRYSNAAAPDPAKLVKQQRGNCASQIRVSDVGQAPER